MTRKENGENGKFCFLGLARLYMICFLPNVLPISIVTIVFVSVKKEITCAVKSEIWQMKMEFNKEDLLSCG